jgi:non-ribosomal peptide synthetase component F
VCAEPAVRTDWRPHLDWTTVEECACRGFFVWTPLLNEGRLGRMTQEDRDTLKQRLRDLRAAGVEAWLTTRDQTVMGALLIRTERPDRPR